MLVKIDATGVGHLERFLVTGMFPIVAFPFVPGVEGVGHVVKAGKGAEHFLGKRVVANSLTGFWA